MSDVVTSIRERVEDLKTRLESGFKQPHDTIELAGLFHELLVHLEGGPVASPEGPQQAETTQDGPA